MNRKFVFSTFWLLYKYGKFWDASEMLPFWSEFSQLWKIHPTQVRAGKSAELKEEVTIKIKGTLYSLAFQKGNILIHWHRNEKLSPEMWFCSQIPLFSKYDWEGACVPTSQSQHYHQGTGYMNRSRGMLSTDLFDNNQQRHWIPAVPVRLKTHLRIKQPAGKGLLCFLLQIISPQWCCLMSKNAYKKTPQPGLFLQGEVELQLIKSEVLRKQYHTGLWNPQNVVLSKRKGKLIFLKQIFQDKELEHSVNNTKAVSLRPVWAIHLKSGLTDPRGSLPTKKILWSECSERLLN